VKSVLGLESKEGLRIEIENLLNLSHLCILSPIGFIIRPESAILGKMQVVRLYAEDSSLTEVISVNSVWRTSTLKTKAKVDVGIGPSFPSAHSLGLIQGHLNWKNVLFDADYRIQITDFYSIDGAFGKNAKDNRVLSSCRAIWSSK
jgi:hypothetical protein